mmetsp:Transcript_15181/g.59407  ORF Transcript_15181/g.59407 Transcript_15181/m.59407 type:complete len:253 (+) Transcript_15181:520-1278(+)
MPCARVQRRPLHCPEDCDHIRCHSVTRHFGHSDHDLRVRQDKARLPRQHAAVDFACCPGLRHRLPDGPHLWLRADCVRQHTPLPPPGRAAAVLPVRHGSLDDGAGVQHLPHADHAAEVPQGDVEEAEDHPPSDLPRGLLGCRNAALHRGPGRGQAGLRTTFTHLLHLGRPRRLAYHWPLHHSHLHHPLPDSVLYAARDHRHLEGVGQHGEGLQQDEVRQGPPRAVAHLPLPRRLPLHLPLQHRGVHPRFHYV